jgi:solute carrier family 25 protein 16
MQIIFQTSEKKFNMRNVLDTMTNIGKQEGMRGLWRGNMATVLRVFP